METLSSPPSSPHAGRASALGTKRLFCAFEDPYIWAQDGKLWAIVKDMRGSFTGAPNAMALFESNDGLAWALASEPLVSVPEFTQMGAGVRKLKRLERPQLWLEDGKPAVLFCAAMDGNDTFNAHIPLRGEADR